MQALGWQIVPDRKRYLLEQCALSDQPASRGLRELGRRPSLCSMTITKTGKHYRLWSESEWEQAARAETTTAWYWGNNEGPVPLREWRRSLRQGSGSQPGWRGELR
jgi:hypothetical protein